MNEVLLPLHHGSVCCCRLGVARCTLHMFNSAALFYYSLSRNQCAQVTWSYHETLKRKERAAAAAASESAGSIELDGAHSTVV